MCAPGEASHGGEPSAGSGRIFGGGRARAGGPSGRRPGPAARGVPDARNVSGRGRLGPSVLRPHPGPEPVADPGPRPPGRPTSGPGGRPASRPLFCSPPPGFRPSLGRRCGRKAPPRTLLESLNGKGAHLPRSGAARLIFAICLYTRLQKKKEKKKVCFVGW